MRTRLCTRVSSRHAGGKSAVWGGTAMQEVGRFFRIQGACQGQKPLPKSGQSLRLPHGNRPRRACMALQSAWCGEVPPPKMPQIAMA